MAENFAEDDEVVELKVKIVELVQNLEEIKGTLVEKFEPRADELLGAQIGEINDRPAFPETYFSVQIVTGRGYSEPGEFTDSSGISRRLKELMKNG